MSGHGHGHDHDHEAYRELALLYPLGGLEPEDRSRLEAHLASGCRSCQAALNAARQVANALALAVTPIDPTPAVERRLMARIALDQLEEDEEEESKDARMRTPWLPAFAAAVLAAVLAGWYALALRGAVESERLRNEALGRELASFQDTIDAMASPSTRTVALQAPAPSTGAQAKAFLDPENRRLFLYVYNLPPPPAGSTYQLWIIVDGTPVSAGTFDVQPDGGTRYDAAPIPAIQGPETITVAVTIEPEGGVPQPTGPMVLAGS